MFQILQRIKKKMNANFFWFVFIWKKNSFTIKNFVRNLFAIIKYNYIVLIATLKKRFSMNDENDRKDKIIKVLWKLKQNDKRFQKYFDETRYIKRHALFQLKFDIVKKIINELNYKIIKRIVDANLTSKTNRIVKKTIK